MKYSHRRPGYEHMEPRELLSATTRIIDINAQTSSTPILNAQPLDEIAVLNGSAYFSACSEDHGCELWRTTDDGATLVRDIEFREESSYPENFTPLGDRLYFIASFFGQPRIWTTNGTALGTSLVADAVTRDDVESSYQAPFGLVAWNGEIYFLAASPSNGTYDSIYRLDSQGQVQIVESNLPGEGVTFLQLQIVGDRLYAIADIPGHGKELTTVLDDFVVLAADPTPVTIDPIGEVDSLFSEIVAFGESLLVAANGVLMDGKFLDDLVLQPFDGGTHRYFTESLWVIDPILQEHGVISNGDAVAPRAPASIVFSGRGNNYFFSATHEQGRELWITDGTAANTRMVGDLRPGAEDGLGRNDPIFAVGGTAYFSANDGEIGAELWMSDGESIELVADINTDGASNPRAFTLYDNGFVFSAVSNEHGRELWYYDTSRKELTRLTDVNPGSSDSVRANAQPYVDGSNIYFRANDGTGEELWSWDGSTASRVADISKAATQDSRASLLVDLNGVPILVADDGKTGAELFRLENNLQAAPIIDLLPDDAFGEKSNLVVANDLVFAATNSFGATLWKTDGTTEGTTVVTNSDEEPLFSTVKNLTALDNEVFFSMFLVDGGESLWKSDGTAAGTIQLGTVVATDNSHQNFTVVGEELFFTIDTELWKSDGSLTGTTLVRDLGSASVLRTRYFTAVGERVFFSALVGEEYGLWTSDGTSEGTHLVSDVVSNRFGPFFLTEFDKDVYFSGNDRIHGWELWKSDGTAEGTKLVRDIATAGSSLAGFNHELVQLGDQLVFSANPQQAGMEIWATDGTEQGTVRLVQLHEADAPASYDVPPVFFETAGDRLFFVVPKTDFLDVTTTEIWTTNGSPDGTFKVDELQGTVSNLSHVDGKLFFEVDTKDFGGEIGVLSVEGDVNGDFEVNFADFLLLATQFGQSGTALAADLNGDEEVNFLDFLELANNFGNSLRIDG